MKIATKAKIRFADYVRPGGYPPSIERRFGVFWWVVKAAHATRPTRTYWGPQGPIELLSMKPTCVNCHEVAPIESLEDLDRRFHYALLSDCGSPAVDRWRAENGISVTSTRWVYFPHRKRHDPRRGPWSSSYANARPRDPGHIGHGLSKALIPDQVRALLGATGKLRVQLNSVHADADNVLGVRIFVNPTGFRFTLDYGVGDSWWHHALATSREGEPFLQTLDRACSEMARVADWPEQHGRGRGAL